MDYDDDNRIIKVPHPDWPDSEISLTYIAEDYLMLEVGCNGEGGMHWSSVAIEKKQASELIKYLNEFMDSK